MDKATRRFVRRRAVIVLGTAMLAASGIGATAVAQRGNDTPTTVCHKPGTSAAHEITFDNDALVQAHLRHGDSLGSCTVAAVAPPGAGGGAAAPAPTATAPTAVRAQATTTG